MGKSSTGENMHLELQPGVQISLMPAPTQALAMVNVVFSPR